MRRAAVITLALVAAITVLTLAFVFSPAAKLLAGRIAEREIEDALGREIEIGAVKGELFNEFQLLNVHFRNGREKWAEIPRIDIKWNPRALLGGKIEIAALSIEDATILAAPPPSRKEKPFKGFEFPERLPALSIGDIRIRNLAVDQAIAGERVIINGAGSVAMGGRALSVRVSLTALDDRDNVAIELKSDPITGDIALDGHVRSTRQGAIAALARAGGPIDLAAKGAGSNEDFELRASGVIGDAGVLEARARSNLENLDAIDLTLSAKPGTRFSEWIGDVGETITAEAIYSPRDRGGRIDVRRAVFAGGALTGAVDWRNSKKALDEANVEVALSLSEGWRPMLQAAVGNTVNVEVSLKRRGEEFAVTGSATAPLLRFNIVKGESDLRTRLIGDVELRTEPESSLSWRFPSGVGASAGLSFLRDSEIVLKRLKLMGMGFSLKVMLITGLQGSAFRRKELCPQTRNRWAHCCRSYVRAANYLRNLTRAGHWTI